MATLFSDLYIPPGVLTQLHPSALLELAKDMPDCKENPISEVFSVLWVGFGPSTRTGTMLG